MSVSPQVAVMPAVTVVPWLETACRFPDSINGSFANWFSGRLGGERLAWLDMKPIPSSSDPPVLDPCPVQGERVGIKRPGFQGWLCCSGPVSSSLPLCIWASSLKWAGWAHLGSPMVLFLPAWTALSLRSCQNGFVLGEDELPSLLFLIHSFPHLFIQYT